MAPERTCVVCRAKSGKQDFVRFVVNLEGDVLVDPLNFISGKASLPGRGAYLHLACVGKQAQGKLLYSLGKNRKINSFDLKEFDLPGLVKDFKSNVKGDAITSKVKGENLTRKKLRFR